MIDRGRSALRDALELIAQHTELSDFVGPRPEEQIAEAEQVLRVQFPPSYRAFLARLGAGNFGSEEFFGLVSGEHGESGVPNGIWLTTEARRDWGLPTQMVVVYVDGGVVYFVLDLYRVDEHGESPVCIVTPGLSTFPVALPIVATDFGSLLLQLVEEELEDAEMDDSDA